MLQRGAAGASRPAGTQRAAPMQCTTRHRSTGSMPFFSYGFRLIDVVIGT
jgi:hypothetical protein